MAQMPSGMQTQLAAGMQGQMATGMQGAMATGMPAGYTWNGASFPMMGDPMSNMMFNNQSAMMANNNGGSGNDSESRSRRRTRSRSRDRSRERSGERRASKRKAENATPSSKASDASNSMTGINPMMGMMAGNMMPMGGGMYPSNMMMGGFAPNMMPSSGMELMPAAGGGMDMMGHAQMEMMNSTGTEMNMMGGMVPMMDPSMMGMGMSVPMGGDVKELVLKNCKLTPPAIGTPLPPRRLKPPGCRTIFIGGLPDKIKEEHVREIFERFGRVYTLRLSKKNFCHIRYEREGSVDMAIALSGYKLRLKLSDKAEDEDAEDKNNSGWLHVDYALSRDDQNDYERKQKRLEREAEREAAREMAVEAPPRSSRDAPRSRARSPSPIARIQPYSSIIVAQISEKIRSEEHFASAVPTLVAWLERGECQKKNAGTFYAMIQATNGQIRRLFNEKMQCDEDLQQAKERVKNNYQKIIIQLEQVAKVLTAAAHQRVWDHFSKPQRKNIETWHKMTEEFQSIRDEFMEKFVDDEHEYGEEKTESSEVKRLKKEKENLQVQLEAYKNEIELMKADTMRDFEKFKAQYIATQALSNMSTDTKVAPLQPPPPPPVLKPPPPPPLPADDTGEVRLASEVEPACGEAKLIGVMSAFLQVHPRGASLDYVVSYVRAQFPSANPATIHHVLQRHADVFQCTTTGVGAAIEHRWTFVAFNNN